MPKDYNLDVTPANAQRRAENAMSDDWTRSFLRRTAIGHVATRWYDADRHVIYFHSNIVGRVRANADRHDRVCFEASEFGRLLPSNVALEFSIQYESAIAFGSIRVVDDADEQRHALYGLLKKYFPTMTPGQEFRPITDQELKRTSVYAIAIDSWSDKRNWPNEAEQSDEWPRLEG